MQYFIVLFGFPPFVVCGGDGVQSFVLMGT